MRLAASRSLAPLAALALASACQGDVAELRADPGEKHAFHIAAPYVTVRTNIEKVVVHCYEAEYDGPPLRVLVSRLRVKTTETMPGTAANITYWQEGMTTRPLFSVDVTAAEDGTDVTFYQRGSYAIFTDYAPIVRGWAMGTGKCGGPTPRKPAQPPEITPLPADTAITQL